MKPFTVKGFIVFVFLLIFISVYYLCVGDVTEILEYKTAPMSLHASATPFIDRWHPKPDNNNPKKMVCAVSIRVTFQRQRKYYATGISIEEKSFDRIMKSFSLAKKGEQRINLSQEEKEIKGRLIDFNKKANNAIAGLDVFTFSLFEKIYLQNRAAIDKVSAAFDEYIGELKGDGRIGTALSYECAKKSICSFRPGLRFADVDKGFLTRYEKWMAEKGNTSTTTGIYLRSLRTLFNRADLNRSLYPFGKGKDKYQIPAGRNIKKALSLEEVSKIFNYKTVPGSNRDRARDYWILSYLCNGANLKDICLLKRKNIDGDFLTFERSKTKRTKKDGQKIVVSLKPQAKEIIKKWGQPSISPESFVFPHLAPETTPDQERKIVQNLTQLINKNMKAIAKDLGINKDVSSYSARHSFSTVLKRSGASIEFISEALGHSNISTTKAYLGSFEKETLQKTTEALINFPSSAIGA